MISETTLNQSNFKHPPIMTSRGGHTTISGPVEVEFHLGDDRWRCQNAVRLIEAAKNPDEMRYALIAIYPALKRDLEREAEENKTMLRQHKSDPVRDCHCRVCDAHWALAPGGRWGGVR